MKRAATDTSSDLASTSQSSLPRTSLRLVQTRTDLADKLRIRVQQIEGITEAGIQAGIQGFMQTHCTHVEQYLRDPTRKNYDSVCMGAVTFTAYQIRVRQERERLARLEDSSTHVF